jgi:CheY-like chemotaxis protein
MMTASRPEQAVITPAEQRPRVLIVDDNDVVRGLLQEICGEYGWNVTSAATAADAILAAGLQEPDLVLLDLHLKDSDGDWLAPLRALHAICPTTPIVVVTGRLPESVVAAITQAGGQAVVGKPCSVAEVARLLGQYRPAPAELAG